MEALQNNLRRFLLPIAQKIEKQRHLQAIKEGMISITPIIIVGSLSMLFMALNNMLPEGSAKTLLSENMDTLLIPNKFTMSLLSIYSAFFIAQALAISSVDNVFAVTIILFITQLLWFFGLHGAAITSSIWMPIAATYMAENATLIAAGGDPKYVFTIGFYYGFLQVTGSGITLGLVYLMSRSKCKSFNSMGKVVILPSLFGINEPVIFGTPIVMNPYMFVPFVFGPVLVGALNFMALKVGLVGLPIAEPPGFLPPGVAAFLMTLDWKAIVLVFASIILMTLIYYPFFKIMEKEELNKNAELATTLDDDSFDF